ncbi:MAG: metalloregulator ArsR/SmtB family transcription factor [Acidobacteria bacterium]|nr:metalloregulator ArsR/SmtB family transcription factor [Acidobacteriota bacterium]MSO63104.1 metalloregulator ArsR/SmtB family transcription factor [Acidobacteriota bacterium]
MTQILDHMAVLADPIRCRMLLPLERHELTVNEICSVLQLPQSTVSRHLKTLADDGWVVSRRDGTSRFYGMTLEVLDSGAQRLWPLIREQLSTTNGAEQDERRLKSVLSRRRSKSEAFFASASGQWDHLRSELFGDRFHLHALLALVEPNLTVGDLGCGTGQVSELLSSHVAKVIAVDGSTDMVQAARRRLKGNPHVELRRGDMEALPIDDAQLDVAILALVLHHVPEPVRALAEVSRVLKPGGRLLIVDMLPHDRDEYQQQMGHVWLGFSEKTIRKHLAAAGFDKPKVTALPTEANVKGPSLFVATAKKLTKNE